MQFAKRVFLFLITNLLVVTTLGVTLSILSNIFGWRLDSGSYLGMLVMASLMGFGGAFISLLMSKTIAKQSQGLHVIDPQTRDSSERWLLDTVYGLARKGGMDKMPEVCFYQSPVPNAFATGPGKDSALVAVSTGLMDGMNKDQVEGVLAHEITHVTNGDMVTMTLIQGVINTFVFFFSWVISMILSSRNSDREGGGNYFMQSMIQNLLQIPLSLLGMLVTTAFSRWREFRADAGGAHLAGKLKMISALQALQQLSENSRLREPSSSLSTLKISGGIGSLFSTHPPLEVRIERLKQSTLM